MVFLPICLNITGRRILVVGGGTAAVHKVGSLVRYTDAITVVAPGIDERIVKMGVECVHGEYAPAMLTDYGLVYACTDDRAVNRRIRADAAARGILANAADDPQSSDFVSPAIYRQGVMSVAVSSNATNVKQSIAWRDRIRKVFEDDSSEGH
jgi:siroheme synthase-like protein